MKIKKKILLIGFQKASLENFKQSISFFKKKKINFDKNYIGLIIPKIQAIDIDDIEDWKIAEALYEKKKT